MSVFLSVCLSVCAIANHPILEVVQTSGWWPYSYIGLWWHLQTKKVHAFFFSRMVIRAVLDQQGVSRERYVDVAVGCFLLLLFFTSTALQRHYNATSTTHPLHSTTLRWHFNSKKINTKNCIVASISIGKEIECLPYAEFSIRNNRVFFTNMEPLLNSQHQVRLNIDFMLTCILLRKNMCGPYLLISTLYCVNHTAES